MITLLALCTQVGAQQLHGHSSHGIDETQCLMIHHPDSALIADNTDSIQNSPLVPDSRRIVNLPIPTYGCIKIEYRNCDPFCDDPVPWHGEQAYFEAMDRTRRAMFASIAASNAAYQKHLDSLAMVPPLTEYTLGIAATAPPASVKISDGPNSANAAQRFLGVVPYEQRTLANAFATC